MSESHKLAGGLNEDKASFIASPTAPESVGGSVGGNRRAYKPPLNEGQKGGVTMKYLAIALLVAPMVLFAYNPGQPLPPGAEEVDTWYWDGSQWIAQGHGNPLVHARLWRSDPEQGSCNKEQWVIDVTVHASIAQWIEWSLSGTRWDWRVRKPGIYAGDCISATVASNNDVLVDYEGFENLQAVDPGAVNPEIPVYYAIGEDINQFSDDDWIAAADLNGSDDLLEDSQALHDGLSWKLWNKIEVSECNTSCEYEDQATITLVLQNVKIWIDPSTGNFIEPQP